MRAWIAAAVLGLCGAAQAQTEQAQTEAQWLQRMDQALAQVQFQGTLVYRRGTELDVVRVASRVGAQGRDERFERLTGAPEALSRSAGELRLGAGQRWIESAASPRPPHPSNLAQIDALYEVRVLGEDRVAGRAAIVLELRARDAFRYSQQLLLDAENGLPLRTRTLALGDVVIEEWLFADIQIGDAGPVLPEVAPAAAARQLAELQPPGERIASYHIVDMPRGFDLTLLGAGVDAVGEQLVFSDGLVTVSVYVEPLRSDRANLSGTHRRGALSVVGRVADGMQITVVGAIPPSTAERFAQGVALRSAG